MQGIEEGTYAKSSLKIISIAVIGFISLGSVQWMRGGLGVEDVLLGLVMRVMDVQPS